jgi:hypothetical protein
MLKTYKIHAIHNQWIDSHDYNKPLIESPFVKVWTGQAVSVMSFINERDPNMEMYILNAEIVE